MEEAEVTSENYLESPEEIYRAIQRLIRYAPRLTARFEGVDDAFATAITKVDLKSKAFAFDKLIPDAGNEILQRGKRLELIADFRGILVKFFVEGGLKYRPQNQEYIAHFPSKLLYLQRRNAYRAMVPRTYSVYAVFRSSEDKQVFKGRLQDISGSGFKAYFKGNITTLLKTMGNFDESTLHVGDESMDCGLDARHAVYDEQKDLTFCGFSFQPLSGMKQRYVEQFVNTLQYEEQRKQQAEEKRKKEADEAKQAQTDNS
ncbi:flagellar brake protein FlgZ [Oceaniserpentilla sp. 4NH20-0058]|uniref:flagellar brake protein n=1 Tax=Oceaniserpentilla sp. 4NH20-0058 TaxID=3127660 RepID=UPI003109756D